MARPIRCGIIQASCDLHADRHPLEKIKKQMIEKHVALVREAAKKVAEYIKEAHKKLVEAVKAIKGSRESNAGGVSDNTGGETTESQ